MSKSLQDQLMGAGLIDKKKAKKITNSVKKNKHEKRRANESLLTDAQRNVQQAQNQKREKDRELNAQLKAEADKKAIIAQVAQLIQQHKISRREGEAEFNFTDGKTVKKMRLSAELLDKVSWGGLSVVRLNESYELVPRPVAEKIREREPSIIVVDNYKQGGASQSEVDEMDDYYAQFEIPDDLMW